MKDGAIDGYIEGFLMARRMAAEYMLTANERIEIGLGDEEYKAIMLLGEEEEDE